MRFVKRLTGITLAVSIVLFDGVSARAQVPLPLKVTTCETVERLHALEIVFTNTSSQAMTSVNFAVMGASGPLLMTRHEGSFAPGSETRRRNIVSMEVMHVQAAIECVPTTVTFADGTTWQNPNIGADMEHALRQTPGSPVVVTDCRAMDSEERMPIIHVSFRNVADQAVRKVDISFAENGSLVWRKADVGTFSPGITIDRQYFAEDGVVPSDLMHQRCVILDATLADGTSWTNPSTPPAAKWPPIASSATESGGQITVTSCGRDKVRYRNDGPLVTKAVDIALVEDGEVLRSLRDLHTLAVGAETGSGFYGEFTAKTNVVSCVPIRVQFADGTQWTSPSLQGAGT